jgi:hypothetical protein
MLKRWKFPDMLKFRFMSAVHHHNLSQIIADETSRWIDVKSPFYIVYAHNAEIMFKRTFS